jgi:hypothetical protein
MRSKISANHRMSLTAIGGHDSEMLYRSHFFQAVPIIHMLSFLALRAIQQQPYFFFPPTSWYFAFFHKQNCTFCQRVFPEFTRVSNVFADVEDLSFFSIDCVLHRSFCHSRSVFGVRDLLLLNSRRTISQRFSGNGTAENMIDFITSTISATPSPHFMSLGATDHITVGLSISAGKCVAIPLFAPPVPLHFRAAFDFFVNDSDFFAAIPHLSLSHSWASMFQGAVGPKLMIVTLLGHNPIIANTSEAVSKYISAVCHGTYRSIMVNYGNNLAAGEGNASLQTIFGPFETGSSFVKLAQGMMDAPIENLSRNIESLRKAIMTWRLADGSVQRMAQKIAILNAVKVMRMGNIGQE